MSLKHLIIINILTLCVFSIDVGDRCMIRHNELEGKCTEVSRCEAAMRQIKDRKTHQFQRCGFVGFEEVVCCPSTPNRFGEQPGGHPNVNIKSQRIADRECEKILTKHVAPLGIHILGGETALIGEFPHMVALGYEIAFENEKEGYIFDCGGSLISESYVLTAAHCVHNKDKKKPKIVRGGVVELGSSEWNSKKDRRIAQYIMNPKYANPAKYHDLALLRLEKPFQFSSDLNAICLETDDVEYSLPLTITGWGTTSNTKRTKSNTLLKANVTEVSREDCNEPYSIEQMKQRLPLGITHDIVCAGDITGSIDACDGDSGGPLLSTTDHGISRLVGVTSFGRGCGSHIPGLYIRVASYLDWIESVVWAN